MEKSRSKPKSKNQQDQALSIEQKARFFDELANRFYKHNFGTLTKAEFELMMFHFYSEQHKGEPDKLDAYTMSKDLGITQERIRNLKIKEYLVYPPLINWVDFFRKELEDKIRYNESDNSIEFPVLDPRLFIEIEHAVELAKGSVRYRTNKKILALSLIDFTKLLVELDSKLKDNEKKDAFELIESAAKAEGVLTPLQLKENLGKARLPLFSDVAGAVSFFNTTLTIAQEILPKVNS